MPSPGAVPSLPVAHCPHLGLYALTWGGALVVCHPCLGLHTLNWGGTVVACHRSVTLIVCHPRLGLHALTWGGTIVVCCPCLGAAHRQLGWCHRRPLPVACPSSSSGPTRPHLGQCRHRPLPHPAWGCTVSHGVAPLLPVTLACCMPSPIAHPLPLSGAAH
jgi:hypothetical protein